MRVSVRTGRSTSMSFGWVGAVVLFVMLAVVVFWIAVAVAAIVVLAGVVALVKWAVEKRQR